MMILPMREKILELEKLARQLEPSPQHRADAQKKVLGYTEDFLNRIETSTVYNTTSDKGVGILNSPISDEPIPVDQAISLIRDFVDYPGLNPASGGHLGYIPGGGIYYASLGDYLADVTNRFAGVFFAGPGAVRM